MSEIKDKNIKQNKGSKKTMVETMLLLYGIPYSAIAENYGDDPRKYKSLIYGDYLRIDREVLKNICDFLGVSTDLVLNGLCAHMDAKVYINNINKWISFEEYILFRSVGIIGEFYFFKKDDEEENDDEYENEQPQYITRFFSKEHGIDLNNPKYMEDFKEMMVKSLLTINNSFNSYALALNSKWVTRCKNEELYEDLIKPYFLKHIDEETFNNCLKRVKIGKIAKKLNINIDINKSSFSYNEVMNILNACLDQNNSDNNKIVKEDGKNKNDKHDDFEN